MAKYKVTVSYYVHRTHIYEFDTEGWSEEEVQDFLDSPTERTCDDNQVEEWDGDVLDGSWEEEVEEIPVLDRIVEALKGAS